MDLQIRYDCTILSVLKNLIMNRYNYLFCLFTASVICTSLACGYKCRASPTGGVCYCPAGWILANDSTTCIGIYIYIYVKSFYREIKKLNKLLIIPL